MNSIAPGFSPPLKKDIVMISMIIGFSPALVKDLMAGLSIAVASYYLSQKISA